MEAIRRRPLVTAVFVALSLVWPRLAWATAAETPPAFSAAGSEETDESKAPETGLRYKAATGVPLFAAAVAAVVLPTRIYQTPPRCRWCDGSDPNLIDRWARKARWEDPCRAAALSNWALGAAGAVSLVPMSHESRGGDWLVNTGAVVDSVAVTMIVTQVVKYTVRRERPSSSTCHPGRASEPDRNLSFFSGHAAVAFAMVSAAQETARLRGHPRNSWVWIGGAASALTGYLRVAGDSHNLIDIVAGASVGYAIGKWVPRHLRSSSEGGALQAVGGTGPLGQPPPLFSYSARDDRGPRVQLGKGPGRSFQISIVF